MSASVSLLGLVLVLYYIILLIYLVSRLTDGSYIGSKNGGNGGD